MVRFSGFRISELVTDMGTDWMLSDGSVSVRTYFLVTCFCRSLATWARHGDLLKIVIPSSFDMYARQHVSWLCFDRACLLFSSVGLHISLGNDVLLHILLVLTAQ